MEETLPSFREHKVRVDYEEVRAFKAPYCGRLTKRFKKGTEQMETNTKNLFLWNGYLNMVCLKLM